ncbi:MAG: type II secretion system protein [Victivallales bacterium]|nr:type II secretion system protein [Victivallales bacterium]
MFKKIKRLRKNFSLIELLIVIGIMGALTALILPQFQSAEEDAKDTGCDYNNSGTLRYVSMFKAVNGVYPSGFHTGLGGTAAASTVYGTDDDDPGIDPTCANLTEACSIALLDDTTNKYLTSMKKAGIVKVAVADEAAADIDGVQVATITGNWFEDNVGGTGDNPTDTLTFQGKSFTEWMAAGTAPDGKDGILVPLFAATTMDWDNYYNENGDAVGESKVSIALPGKCPWPEDGKLRFYICFFKAYADGSPAKLIGTACPECGTLNAGTF